MYGSGLVCCCLCQGGVFWFGLGRFSPATLRIQLEKTRESWGLSFCPWCEIFGSVISERNCFTYFSPLNENGGFFFTGIVNFTKILFAPGLSYGNGRFFFFNLHPTCLFFFNLILISSLIEMQLSNANRFSPFFSNGSVFFCEDAGLRTRFRFFAFHYLARWNRKYNTCSILFCNIAPTIVFCQFFFILIEKTVPYCEGLFCGSVHGDVRIGGVNSFLGVRGREKCASRLWIS